MSSLQHSFTSPARLTSLMALVLFFVWTVVLPAKEMPKLVACIEADLHGTHSTEIAYIFWSKREVRIEEAGAPHRVLLKAGRSLRQNSVSYTGAWIRPRQTKVQGDTAHLHLRPTDEKAALLLHAMGIYVFHAIGEPSVRGAIAVRSGNRGWMVQPGLGQSTRVVFFQGADRLEVRLAPPGHRFIPSRLTRRLSTTRAFRT